jgi:hypothetical protein
VPQYIRIVVASVVLVVAPSVVTAQVFEQVALPFNADVIREPGGTISGGGIEGFGFVTQAEAAANDPNDPHGLPEFVTVSNGTLQLGLPDRNNALRFGTSGESASYFIGGETLARWRSVQIYAAGSGSFGVSEHAAPLQVFLGGPPTGVGSADFQWDADPASATFGTVTYLLNGMDTTGPGGTGFNDADDMAVFCWDIPLHGGHPTTELRIQLPAQGPPSESVAILAITGTPKFPEPSVAGVALAAGCASLLRRRRS